MTPERWQRISAAFAAAQRLAPDQRAAYLEAALGGHPEDRREVEALLAGHASGFLEAATGAAGAPALGPGDRFGRYRIVHELGRGGMGIVYLAEDTELDRRAALKVLATGPGPAVLLRDHLVREARLAARIEHRGVATVYGIEEDPRGLAIATEFVRGRTLRARLDEGPLEPGPLLDLAVAVAEALAAAHAAGVIHRDLKPENILLAQAGGIKLVDFGIAHLATPDTVAAPPGAARDGHLVGTAGYMSPEQIRRGALDARTDIFSLGVVLYEAAAGEHPFLGATLDITLDNILRREPPPLVGRRDARFAEIDRILARCLHKEPEARYRDAVALLVDLEAARRQAWARAASGAPEKGPVAPGDFVATAPRPMSPRWWWQVHQLAVSAAQILLLVAVWFARSQVPAGPFRTALLPAAAVLAATAVILRGHWWYQARYQPWSVIDQGRRTRWLVVPAETGFALLLAAAGALVVAAGPLVATILFVGAVGLILSLAFIEPATARAAFFGAPPHP
jgi:hypothetical protein